MRTLAIAFLMLAVLPAGRHAMAADSAASLIEAVSRNASNADTWEAEGRLVTQETADDAGPRTAASFRIVIERVPEQRARLEITGVPAPLTRVCDGSIQWGHLPAVRLFWSVGDSRIDACAEPFDEWPYLAADLHDPVITGREQLQPGKKVIECTVVSGDYAGSDASRSGKRTLWIDEVTNDHLAISGSSAAQAVFPLRQSPPSASTLCFAKRAVLPAARRLRVASP